MSEETTGKQKTIFPLTHLAGELLAFVEMANAMLEAKNLDEILSAITREVGRLVRFDRSSVAILSDDKKSLILRNIHKGAQGPDEKFGEGREIPMDERSVIGWVATHRRPLLRQEIGDGNGFQEVVQEEPLHSDIVVPLLIGNKLMGTLNVGSYEANAFTERDLEALENCGKFASIAIEHTLLRIEAQALSERYRGLQENANDMILVVDKNTGSVTDVNRKCERVLGYTRQDLLRKSYFDLFAPEDQYPSRRDFINILSQKSMNIVDRRMIDRDGNIIYVDINANLIKIGEDLYIQAIVHDVSQRRMLEQQIIRQNKNLQTVNKKLMQVDSMKTEFLANISHELRTPLSIIIAYAEQLRDPDLSADDRSQFVQVIAENGGSLLRLINNLLDLSKLEISGQMLNMSLSHIHDVIKSIWSEVERAAQERNINASFNPTDDVPITYFDNNQITRVVQCLISNAIKFTDDGGYVEVNTSRGNRHVIVEVTDTGIGIRPDKIDGIFETFRQGDGSSSRKWGGLGIGLALAKHIVELHKGELQVRSEFGIGSTFTVILPADTEEIARHSQLAVRKPDVDVPETAD